MEGNGGEIQMLKKVQDVSSAGEKESTVRPSHRSSREPVV